jgi:organic radical activating enzyme
MKTFGRRLNPFISPLAPFLDHGSIAFEKAEEVGYRVYCKTLEDYRKALLAPSWKYTLSYETKWMSRDEIVESSYQAGLRLNRMKERFGLLDGQTAQKTEERILLAMEMIGKKWLVDELVREVVKDRAYFEKSGGGITASGGEPAVQAGFVSQFFKALKDLPR